MGLFSKKPIPEAPQPSKPIPSEEFSKLQSMIVELSGKIGILGAELTRLDMEVTTIKKKWRNVKTPEEAPGASSGLPTTTPKGLNTYNPFL